MTSSLTAAAPWLWVPVVLFAALAQTVRNTAQRSLTAELGTLPATLVRFLYGLGAYGELGVTRVLEIIRKELDLTMAFCGRTDINTVDTSILLPGTYPTP